MAKWTSQLLILCSSYQTNNLFRTVQYNICSCTDTQYMCIYTLIGMCLTNYNNGNYFLRKPLHIKQHFSISTRIVLNRNNFHLFFFNLTLHLFSLTFDSLVLYLPQLFKTKGKKSHVYLRNQLCNTVNRGKTPFLSICNCNIANYYT